MSGVEPFVTSQLVRAPLRCRPLLLVASRAGPSKTPTLRSSTIATATSSDDAEVSSAAVPPVPPAVPERMRAQLSQAELGTNIVEPSLDEQGRARLPAGYAPGSNVAQLWDVRIPEGDAAPETPRSRSEAADAAVLLELSGGRPESSGGDAAAVDSVAAQGESARTGDSTRDSSQGGLAAQLLEDSGRLTALAPGKTGSKAKARSFMDDVRNSTLSQAGAPAAPGGTRSRTSKRSEDEQIRADRQRRMEQQGLTGAGREAGWRAADRSDGSGASASEALTDGTKELSRALGARMPDAVPADTQYTAEQFTLRKTERDQAKGADVISIQSDYKPAVGTWGVYARPRDISAAYGGGRALTPADSVMTKEERAEYDQRMRKKMRQYRASQGLLVDPAKARECTELTAQGKALMDRGALKAALRYFEAALDMVALRTEAGGEAALQRAITLDSLQRHEEARDLYAQLRRHRTAQIAKKARQLDFGFDAGKFLKADTMSYAATREEYDPFFTALSGIGKWTDPYVESEEEKARQARDNMLLFAGALALMATPIGFIGVLAIR